MIQVPLRGRRQVFVPRSEVKAMLKDYEQALYFMAYDAQNASCSMAVRYSFEYYLPTEKGSCRLRKETREAYEKLLTVQPGDSLALDVTIGGQDEAGLAPAEARERMVAKGRFPLDPIVVWRLIRGFDLSRELIWLDTLGAEVSPKADGRFDDTPYFDCRMGHIIADWNWATRARSFRLVVSAAMP